MSVLHAVERQAQQAPDATPLPRAWLRVAAPADPEAGRALRRALEASGVEVVDFQPRVPGIVLFDGQAPPVDPVPEDGGCRFVAVHLGELRGDLAWSLLGSGAADVLPARGSDVAGEIRARLERWAMLDHLLEAPLVCDTLVGESPAWLSAVRQLVEVAVFSDAPVLLLGESGSGKELAARVVHALDRRRSHRELVVLDCGTLVPELAGSELFGHERGAFTGAAAPREGAFALAQGGTLFIDEIGELPPALQTHLLRVVQEGAYKRLGGNAWSKGDFRLVCATNRDLGSEVQAGRFRQDLFHRIASCVVRLPPLRERPGDVLCLARHFLAETLPSAPDLDGPVREYLTRRDYPGNVRELRQLVVRMAYRHAGSGPITVGDIPPDERPLGTATPTWSDAPLREAIRHALAQGAGLKEIGRCATDAAVRLALALEDGNLQRAARRLGVTDRALQLRRAPARGTLDARTA